MKCEICNQEIIYKKDLCAGPYAPAGHFHVGAILGKKIKTFHKDCFNKRPITLRASEYDIIPISGKSGTFFVLFSSLFFTAFAFLAGITFFKVEQSKIQDISLVNPEFGSHVLWFVGFGLVLVLIFEILMIRLKMKVKKEYENLLK